MKQEEKDYLKVIHKSEGYNPSTIYKSINKLENSQVKFKALTRELKKKDTIIRNLESKIEKLKTKLEKTSNPLISIKRKASSLGKDIFAQDVDKEEYEKCRLLINRIIRNMELERQYTRTDMSKEFLIYYKKLDFCIGYLLHEKLIVSTIKNGFTYYEKVENS